MNKTSAQLARKAADDVTKATGNFFLLRKKWKIIPCRW